MTEGKHLGVIVDNKMNEHILEQVTEGKHLGVIVDKMKQNE